MSARVMRQAQLAVEDTAIFREDDVPCSYPGCANRILKIDLSTAPTRTPYCDTHRCNYINPDGSRCKSGKAVESAYCDVHNEDHTLINFPDRTNLEIQDFAAEPYSDDEIIEAIQAEIEEEPNKQITLESPNFVGEAQKFLDELDNRTATFSSKVTVSTQNTPNKLKGFSIETYGFRFDISVQVSMAIQLLDIFARDPEIINMTKDKLGSKRASSEFHKALYLSILEKWNKNTQ